MSSGPGSIYEVLAAVGVEVRNAFACVNSEPDEAIDVENSAVVRTQQTEILSSAQR